MVDFKFADLSEKMAINSSFINLKDENDPVKVITAWVKTGQDKYGNDMYNAELITEKGNRTVMFDTTKALNTRLKNIEIIMSTLKLQSEDVALSIKYNGKKATPTGQMANNFFVQILAPDALVELAKSESLAKKASATGNIELLTPEQLITKIKTDFKLPDKAIDALIEREITDLHGLIDKDSALLIAYKRLCSPTK